MLMRTSNPALRADTFNIDAMTGPAASSTMTLQGTVNKTALLLVCTLATSLFTWSRFGDAVDAGAGLGAGYQAVAPWMWGGLIGGLVFAIATTVKKTWAPFTAPLYAGFEGLFLGAISAMFEAQFPGIVIQAVGLTLGILAALLLAYTTRLIKPSENFKLAVCAATGGICLFYAVAMVLRFFGIQAPLIWDSGWFGIGFSLFVIVIAALNLVLDFDFIEKGAEARAPKYMEWYGAFGLLVTLVWLYIEVLHLLAKLQSRE